MSGRAYRGVPPRPGFGSELERGWANRGPDPALDVPEERFELPYVGITSGGTITPDLYPLGGSGGPTGHIVYAAQLFIADLVPEQIAALVKPLNASEWRRWTSGFPRWRPHGVCLEDLTRAQREVALAMVAVSLSPEGFDEVRDAMRLNAALGELIDSHRDTLTEWMYWITIFGEPASDKPWGWQLAGHHVDYHCLVLDDQVVMTPQFLGAEFCEADDGPHAGVSILQLERARALEFGRSLTDEQGAQALLFSSMLSKDLPDEFKHFSEGRMRAGNGADNSVIPYEGLSCGQLSSQQRMLLLDLIDAYIGRMGTGHREAKLVQIQRHLDDTHIAWIGGMGDDDPFYYKIQSPVLLIEYDCQKGMFLKADEPWPFHVHTVVRTPNGNDYGKKLLQQRGGKLTS